ncbi:MAG: ATP-binding protein [bacterium]|nr:ATP-binding protein [bacterium]
MVDDIPVRMSYEIIRLFSEGLYQSPHKAVEELVTNGYDAGAERVWIFTPREEYPEDSLWVVDDGSGMDSHGFENLWHVADPRKSKDPETGIEGRVAIGQFGIGKLAAYVLAERLTHISKHDSRYLATSMDFTRVREHHQWEESREIKVQLRKLSEDEAMELLHEIADRDDDQVWSNLFGNNAKPTWTAAALSEFKPLMDDFQVGTLRWVLRTGLPILTDFHIILNGSILVSPKVDLEPLECFTFGGEDPEVEKLKKEKYSIEATADSVSIDGIKGVIKGYAAVYPSPLEGGKSDRYSRSYGIFVKIRQRIVNLEDETFGLPVQNHAAWHRTVIRVEADGLTEFLQSSREGVRETRETRTLQQYLQEKFLRCRRTYNAYLDKQLVGDEIHRLVAEAPSRFVTNPLIDAVRRGITDPSSQMYYLRRPAEGEATDLDAWVAEFETAAANEPISDIVLAEAGRNAPVASYEPTTRVLHTNREHPYVAHVIQHSRGPTLWKLFAASELLLEALAQAIGLPHQETEQLLRFRDRILRILLKDQPAVIGDILGLLAVAGTDETAMERATGAAFEALGFDYQKRGGSRGGTDGVLEANLGVSPGSRVRTSFKLVFDAKTCGGAVPNERVRFDALHRFQRTEKADFAFAIADKFQGEDDDKSAINEEAKAEQATVLTTSDLQRLLLLHASFGIPLPTMRELFAGPYRGTDQRGSDQQGHFSRQDVLSWLQWLESELGSAEARVPVRQLLERLEAQKEDPYDAPTISRVRLPESEFISFQPSRLLAVLKGIQAVIGDRYLMVDDDRVYLHQSVDEILGRYDQAVESELRNNS